MKRSKLSLLIFLGPALLLYGIILLYPTVRTASMSLFRVPKISSVIADWEFVAVDNFIRLFNTELFTQSLINLFKVWLFGGFLTLSIALILASILASGVKGKSWFRTIIYLPEVIASIAIGYMWLLYVFNSKFGLLNSIGKAIGWTGLAEFKWTSPENLLLSMILATVFGSVGYYFLMYMAAIEKIPSDYYEASQIEGAGGVRQFFTITLPLITDVIKTSIVLWSSGTIGFFTLSVVFSGISTVTPMVYVYNTLFGTEFSSDSVNVGIAAAAAVVMTILVIFIFTVLNAVLKKADYEY